MSNRVEIVSDAVTDQFSLKLNGSEVDRVKAFVLKGDSKNSLTEMTLVIDVDTLRVS